MRRFSAVLAFLGAAALVAGPARAEPCTAATSGRTTALVELYTSEGCSSCPPADRWLSSLGTREVAPGRVVPIALHVDYWDYIGWKDPYAQHAFSLRQRALARLQGATFVYTPQVLLQGRDFRSWGGAAFDRALAAVNAQPARARLRLTIEGVDRRNLKVDLDAELLAGLAPGDAVLYLATYENRLVSAVKAGENEGATLHHDYVVRDWVGPLAFGAGPRLAGRHDLPLAAGVDPAQSGVAVFVQKRSTGEAIQALMLPVCRG